jgi:hypothetical protein
VKRRGPLAAVGVARCAAGIARGAAGIALGAAGIALCAALAALTVVGGPHLVTQARAAGTPSSAGLVQHVVVVGISGLTWNVVSRSSSAELWRLAAAGSVGSVVDYAQEPLACAADGWLTLNSAARAQGPRPCTSLPAVTREGEGGPRTRLRGRHRPLLPAVSRRPVPVGAGPLPADRR